MIAPVLVLLLTLIVCPALIVWAASGNREETDEAILRLRHRIEEAFRAVKTVIASALRHMG